MENTAHLIENEFANSPHQNIADESIIDENIAKENITEAIDEEATKIFNPFLFDKKKVMMLVLPWSLTMILMKLTKK